MSALGELSRLKTSPGRGKTKIKIKHKDNKAAYWFLMPWLVGLVAITIGPMFMSLYLSFTDFDPRAPGDARFIGLANYQRMLRDPVFLESLWVTIKFAALI